MKNWKACFGDGGEQAAHNVLLENFSKDASRDDGLSVYCRACAAARQRAWKKTHPEQVKAAKREYRTRRKEAQC